MVNLRTKVSLVKSAFERVQTLCRNNIMGQIMNEYIIPHVNNTVSEEVLVNVM